MATLLAALAISLVQLLLLWFCGAGLARQVFGVPWLAQAPVGVAALSGLLASAPPAAG